MSVRAAQAVGLPVRIRTLYASGSFETPTGRCLAVRLVPSAAGRAASPRVFVLFESRYERLPWLRWVPAGQVLDEADAERWAKEGFRR